jgi:photosystem II stability/assembly factor-like uncharacterized protein
MKRLSLAVVALALALGGPAAAQAAPVGVGHSGWAWGNPQPQGSILRAIEFHGSHGFASGNFGTLLRTDDGGRSWTAARSGTRASTPWDHISIAGSSVVYGGGCFMSRSDDNGLTFIPIPTRCSPVLALSFPSPSRGFRLLGDGVVQRTDDGRTFTDVGPLPHTVAAGGPTPPTDDGTDIFFTDGSTGFAVTRGSSGGAVYRTTDAGQTWFQRATSPENLKAVWFFDAATGYAVGENNTVLKTTDGGETWDPKPVPDAIPKGDLRWIRCGTSANCMITSESGERVLHTTNGGNTYTALTPAAEQIYAVAYTSNSDAVAVGDQGTTVITTNANQQTPAFVRVGDDPLPGPLSRLRSGSPGLVLAPGRQGRLARSTDGGAHWTSIQLPTSDDLRDAWFVDDAVGFALDASGRVFRTANAGDNWTEFGTAPGVQPDALYAPDQNTVLLFGPTGVRRGTGGSFDLVGDDVMKGAPIFEYDRTGGGVIFAYGEKALFVSRDAGVSWKLVRPPNNNVHYRKVDFVTRNVGFAVLESGRLFRTGNGGKSWREVLSTGSKHLIDISFPDRTNGFLNTNRWGVSAPSGWVLRTSDGGITWRPQLVSEAPFDPGGFVAPDATTAFAKALGFRLFFTSTGGDLATTPSTLELTPSRTVVTSVRRVKVTGKLTPGRAGATVRVLRRDNTTHQWIAFAAPHVDAAGKFTVSPRITNTTQLIAQWAGNADVRGAGSHYVTIRKR